MGQLLIYSFEDREYFDNSWRCEAGKAIWRPRNEC